ncbi:uncharacterized protein LOC114606815 [Podarcis muralis]
MSQGVTYADLRFVRTPPEKSQEKDPSEGELTYENIQGPPCQEKRTPIPTEGTKGECRPESDRRTWYTILALLAVCLFLLTAAIGLGVRYWQVSRQLQQATEDGSALERRMGSQEGSLAQTQAQLQEAKEELHSTNRTLWNCLAARNRTQEQLRQANQSLMFTQREKEKLQQEKEELQRDKEELEEEKEQQQEDKARLQEEKETVQQQLEEMRGKLERGITCQQKDGQLSQQLQRESQNHAAQSNLLTQRLGTLEESLSGSQELLRKAERDLRLTQKTLEESWRDGNRTQQQLRDQVRQADLNLTHLKHEKEQVERALGQATSCQQMGCCPHGWKIFRWKCLWVSPSSERKSWGNSKEACQARSSQLLILKPWSARELWDGVIASDEEVITVGYK